MHPCPRCGVALGEGAKACAACGWRSSRGRIWILLGVVFGGMILLCCGGGALVAYQFRGAVEIAQADGTPVLLRLYRLQVVSFAHGRGALPATLEEAVAEPLRGKDGKRTSIRISNDSGAPMDSWQRTVRYVASPDGSFELRSAGPDGVQDNGDDIVLRGSRGDDLSVLERDLATAAKDLGRRVREAFPGWLRDRVPEPSVVDFEIEDGDPGDPADGTPPPPADLDDGDAVPPAPERPPDGAGGGR